MGRLLDKAVAVSSTVTVLTYFLSMVLIVLLLVFTSLGQDLLNHTGTLVLGAFLVPVYTPVRIDLLESFLVLLAIYVICFAVAVRSDGGFVNNLRALLKGSHEKKIPQWLVVMPVLSSALVLIVFALTQLQSAAGVSTGSLPSLEPYRYLYTLVYAPPLEEMIFRISTLGLLVALRVIWSSSLTPAGTRPRGLARLIVLSFLLPEKAKGEVGLPTLRNNGWHAFTSAEWLALVVTSAGFGLAHLLSNIGWQAGKIATAALSGFALGIAFLAYGAYASILLHWFFDVYLGTLDVGLTLLPGVFYAAAVLIILLIYAVGIVGIVAGIAWLASGRLNRRQTPYITPMPPPSP